MDLRLRPHEYAKQAVESAWGDVAQVSVLADLLRAEVTARGSCTRRAAVRRIEQAATGTVQQGRDRIDTVCRQLEAEGDLNTSRGGMLHVTPVRAIELSPGEYRLICSLPTTRLAAKLPGDVIAEGIRRNLRLEEGEAPALAQAMERVGGLVLSPEAWAGLSRVPIADEAWLTSLDERLRWLPEDAGSQERDGALDWRELTLTSDGPRFRSGTGDDGVRLWRAKSHLGQWLWVWGTAGSSPATGSFVTLPVDDANRAVFALARVAGAPVSASVTKDVPTSTLHLDAWLPRAEYRYLSTIASPAEGKGAWSIPEGNLDQVLDVLSSRLGITMVQTESPKVNASPPNEPARHGIARQCGVCGHGPGMHKCCRSCGARADGEPEIETTFGFRRMLSNDGTPYETPQPWCRECRQTRGKDPLPTVGGGPDE